MTHSFCCILYLYNVIVFSPFVVLQEYLLVFSTFGVYVDSSGRRSRAMELMFPASPASGKALGGDLCHTQRPPLVSRYNGFYVRKGCRYYSGVTVLQWRDFER